MRIFREFQEFALKGNVMDLAVGVIIGGAFAKIVDSLVGDIIMPLASALLGGHLDFSNLFMVLGKVPEGTALTYDALKKAGVPLFAYGNFITITINFLLLAFVIFQLVKFMNHLRNLQSSEDSSGSGARSTEAEQITLLREIRDSLKK
jgi:large conductance mechanosensitive channel